MSHTVGVFTPPRQQSMLWNAVERTSADGRWRIHNVRTHTAVVLVLCLWHVELSLWANALYEHKNRRTKYRTNECYFGANLPRSFDTEVLAIVGSRSLRHRAPRFSSASGRFAQSRGRNANKNNASLFSASAWLLNPGHNKCCFRFIVHVHTSYIHTHTHPTPPARMSDESAGESEYRLFGVVLKNTASGLAENPCNPFSSQSPVPRPPNTPDSYFLFTDRRLNTILPG